MSQFFGTIQQYTTTICTYTATGTAGAQLKFIEILDAYGQPVENYSQMTATPTTKKFQYTVGTKTISFFSAEVPNNTKIRVHYYPTTSSARKISQLTNVGSATLRWELNGIFKDVCTSQEVRGLIKIPKAHLMGNFDWATSEGGDPAVHNFSITAEKTCANELWDTYVFETADLT